MLKLCMQALRISPSNKKSLVFAHLTLDPSLSQPLWRVQGAENPRHRSLFFCEASFHINPHPTSFQSASALSLYLSAPGLQYPLSWAKAARWPLMMSCQSKNSQSGDSWTSLTGFQMKGLIGIRQIICRKWRLVIYSPISFSPLKEGQPIMWQLTRVLKAVTNESWYYGVPLFNRCRVN